MWSHLARTWTDTKARENLGSDKPIDQQSQSSLKKFHGYVLVLFISTQTVWHQFATSRNKLLEKHQKNGLCEILLLCKVMLLGS